MLSADVVVSVVESVVAVVIAAVTTGLVGARVVELSCTLPLPLVCFLVAVELVLVTEVAEVSVVLVGVVVAVVVAVADVSVGATEPAALGQPVAGAGMMSPSAAL